MRLYTLLITMTLMLGMSFQSESQVFNLNNPQNLTPTVSQKAIWQGIHIYPPQKKMVIDVDWEATTGEIVSEHWTCRDIVIEGTNAECITGGNPYPCCTGSGTGTCDDDWLCFSDTFSSQIQCPAHNGIAIGAGLRTIIKNAWRDRRIPGNDGTFE